MAHGSPRINICYNCDQYTLVPRFSEDPKCPTCGEVSKQTDRDEIKKQYPIEFLYNWKLNFDHWEKLPEPRENKI